MDQVYGRSSEDRLDSPIKGGRALTTEERRTIDLSSSIKGWGSDLDPMNRPGVPMDRAPSIGVESLYPEIEQQVPGFKIFKSKEHGKMTPVFGTSCPPRGVSGVLRDFAYRFSEGRLVHWVMLMFADRVDVIEDILRDFTRLRIPNVPKEMGLKAELKYNRKSVARKAVLFGFGLIALISLSAKIRSRRTGS